MKNPSAHTQLRRQELLKAYATLADSVARIVPEDFFRRLVNLPSSRFWVSEERASAVISLMERGKPLPKMRITRLDMYREIFRRYSLLRQENPLTPLKQLIGIIINQPAPKFYMTPGSARQLLYQEKWKRRRKYKK